jgi:hypothetical protein
MMELEPTTFSCVLIAALLISSTTWSDRLSNVALIAAVAAGIVFVGWWATKPNAVERGSSVAGLPHEPSVERRKEAARAGASLPRTSWPLAA